MTNPTPTSKADEWILSSDTGISSKVIWAVMMGISTENLYSKSTPCDPSDFGRCYRLLQLIPEWEEKLDKLRSVHLELHVNVGLTDERHNKDRWGTFVDNYEGMKELYEKEFETGSCPKLYNFMRSLCL